MKPDGDPALLETRAEIFRLARICAPSLDQLGKLTFQGNPSNTAIRRVWRDTVLVPVLAPALESAWLAGKAGFRELLAADAALEARLATSMTPGSRAAGRQMAAAFHAPAGETGLLKFREAILRGETPGHMAILFAGRAAVFHFPRPLVLPALVFAEMREVRVAELWTLIDDCIAPVVQAGSTGLRAA